MGCYRHVAAFALLCGGLFRGVAAFALLCGGLLQRCCCICIALWWAVRDMLLRLHCCVEGCYRGVAAFVLLCEAVCWAVTDVLLKCLGMDWELHRPFLQKAETLAQQLKDVDDPAMHKYYRSPVSQTLDTYISHSKFYR